MLRLHGKSNETNKSVQSQVEYRNNACGCPTWYTITARGHQMFMFSWGSIATPWSISSWEANRFSASQEIPHVLWNPKVHYRIYKCPTLVHIQSLLNQSMFEAPVYVS